MQNYSVSIKCLNVLSLIKVKCSFTALISTEMA